MKLHQPKRIAAVAALALSVGFAPTAFAQNTTGLVGCLQPGQSLIGFTTVNGIPQTSDGVTFYDASEATRMQFVQAWGDCAPIQWAIEHEAEIAMNPAIVNAPPSPLAGQGFDPMAPTALDGQTLADQPITIQQEFINTWGSAAAERWVAEHDTKLLAAGFPLPATGE